MFRAMARAHYIEDMAPVLKGRANDLPETLLAESDSHVFDALLYPHRSLPNSGFIAVMTIVIVINLTLGLYFFSIGAWPVLGFCGLDIFFVWLAFKLSYRQGRLHERVRVTPDAMWVSRVLPSGHESRWRLQPFWTDVRIDRPVEHESQVRVVSKGRTLILGSFLSPEERGEFADALAGALGRLRSRA
jgi:uncharacterized membrane protein